ncbi:MAG TPA: sugar phosphate isomerase/epimerase family protein [Fimbriimonadales bacterium]|nr:sugar phosphate isomerase/epimerase family protein [Fimbriimonadales bacterium]
MNINEQNLRLLETKYADYLEGSLVDEFLNDFGIKFAAGHWCAGEFYDRFCPVGYNSNINFDNSVPAQISRVAKAGIKGIEFHNVLFTSKDGKDPEKIEEARKALEQHNVVATNMNMNTWTDPKWKFGGITHPDPSVRKDALAMCLEGVEIAKELGCVSCNIWPGSDGWDYHFETNYGKRFDWYIEGCTKIAKKCDEKGLKFGTEPKQKEPREGNMIVNTVAKAAIVALEVNKNLGKTVMGVVIDYGHEQMVGNTPADSLYMLKRVGVPIANFHINGAKYNSNDEDRIAGTDDIWRLVDFCYAAIDTGYDGWFGEDQFTYRTEQVVSMRLSMEFFANCMKKAMKIYAKRNELEKAQSSGDAANTIQVVKRILYSG